MLKSRQFLSGSKRRFLSCSTDWIWENSSPIFWSTLTDVEVGLLFNFGPCPEFRRLAFDNSRKGRNAKAASQP
jgi:hypothetical protein